MEDKFISHYSAAWVLHIICRPKNAAHNVPSAVWQFGGYYSREHFTLHRTRSKILIHRIILTKGGNWTASKYMYG